MHMRQADAVAAHPQRAVRTFDEWVPEYRANMRSGPLYDAGDAATGTGLLGKGKHFTGTAPDTAIQQLTRFLQRSQMQAWAPDASVVCFTSYTMAHKRGDEILWSKGNGRSRTWCHTSLRACTHESARTMLHHNLLLLEGCALD